VTRRYPKRAWTICTINAHHDIRRRPLGLWLESSLARAGYSSKSARTRLDSRIPAISKFDNDLQRCYLPAAKKSRNTSPLRLIM
jgi:hypothetical protein